LKTTDRHEAKRNAENVLIELLSKIRNGEKILSYSIAEVLRLYRSEQQRLVQENQVAAKTVLLQSYRINLGMEFIASFFPTGNATKITAINGEIFKDYVTWRRAKRAAKGKGLTIRLDVIRDELLSIRKLFHFAREKKLCSDRNIPVWDFVVEREAPKRRRITVENYTDFLNCIKAWKGKSESAKDRYYRELLFHFVLVISNTGLRSGELFGLKNRDVEIREKANECVLTVRPETSKVRKGRQITLNQSFGGRAEPGSGINYLIRWIQKWQIHKDPNHFVFAPFDKGSKSIRDIYYHYYKNLRADLGEIGLGFFDTYHCRHFWITNRLYAGEPIHLVARAAGTSTSEIEETYSNVLTELATRQFGRKRLIYDKGTGYGVVPTPKQSK
jgi:integrase